MIDNKYIEKLDASDIRWYNYLIHEKGKESKALDSILNDLNCSKVYADGSRPMMTINYGYRRNVAGFLYILGNMEGHNPILAKEYKDKLENIHKSNLEFEVANPPINYGGKIKTVKNTNRTTKAKDMFSDKILDVSSGIATAVKKKENAKTRKAAALSGKSINFAFNNFKVNK